MATQKLGDITISKQSGTILTLATSGKYVPDDVYFTIAAQPGAGTVTVASTDANISDDGTPENIHNVIGTKSGTAPLTGYYIKVDTLGTGNSSITTAGWLDVGTLGTASAAGSFYFPVQGATATATGTNTVTPSASITGSNVVLSNVNNGVQVTATGGGTAEATITATSTRAGYVPNGQLLATATASASSATTTANSYISGVILRAPASGTNQFTVNLPNGSSDTITLTFKVESDGSWAIE